MPHSPDSASSAEGPPKNPYEDYVHRIRQVLVLNQDKLSNLRLNDPLWSGVTMEDLVGCVDQAEPIVQHYGPHRLDSSTPMPSGGFDAFPLVKQLSLLGAAEARLWFLAREEMHGVVGTKHLEVGNLWRQVQQTARDIQDGKRVDYKGNLDPAAYRGVNKKALLANGLTIVSLVAACAASGAPTGSPDTGVTQTPAIVMTVEPSVLQTQQAVEQTQAAVETARKAAETQAVEGTKAAMETEEATVLYPGHISLDALLIFQNPAETQAFRPQIEQLDKEGLNTQEQMLATKLTQLMGPEYTKGNGYEYVYGFSPKTGWIVAALDQKSGRYFVPKLIEGGKETILVASLGLTPVLQAKAKDASVDFTMVLANTPESLPGARQALAFDLESGFHVIVYVQEDKGGTVVAWLDAATDNFRDLAGNILQETLPTTAPATPTPEPTTEPIEDVLAVEQALVAWKGTYKDYVHEARDRPGIYYVDGVLTGRFNEQTRELRDGNGDLVGFVHLSLTMYILDANLNLQELEVPWIMSNGSGPYYITASALTFKSYEEVRKSFYGWVHEMTLERGYRFGVSITDDPRRDWGPGYYGFPSDVMKYWHGRESQLKTFIATGDPNGLMMLPTNVHLDGSFFGDPPGLP